MREDHDCRGGGSVGRFGTACLDACYRVSDNIRTPARTEEAYRTYSEFVGLDECAEDKHHTRRVTFESYWPNAFAAELHSDLMLGCALLDTESWGAAPSEQGCGTYEGRLHRPVVADLKFAETQAQVIEPYVVRSYDCSHRDLCSLVGNVDVHWT